ncbi:transporter substrate-binding domain-containing protein [Pseudovibrio flavus]|uniref:transporter substrate-binding domain-containing protein n=1 Tax=Pseudovibrio flavus TaxID=2529854 RepID=UPI003527E35D
MSKDDFLPWIGHDDEGHRIGYEVDVAMGLASALDVELELVELGHRVLLQKLNEGEVDVVISGVPINGVTAREVLFSIPYNQVEYSLVIDADVLPLEAAERAFDIPQLSLGVIMGTVADSYASKRFRNASIRRYVTDIAAYQGMLNGEVNGFLMPTPYPALLVSSKNRKFVVVEHNVLATVSGMALRPDSMRFLNYINSWIEETRASRDMANVFNYWFGSLDWVRDVYNNKSPSILMNSHQPNIELPKAPAAEKTE